jgi:hypothetical protein
VEIKIGVQNASREITLESDLAATAVKKIVEEALTGPLLELTDVKGRLVIVPTAAIAYIEIGSEEKRRVGFGG